MKAVRKHTLAAEAERELRAAILGGQFGKTLPGLRVLAQALGVSPPTVADALKTLVAEGLVTAGGPRRRMEVVAETGPRELLDRPDRILWFVTAVGVDKATHGITDMTSFLQQMLAGAGWQVRHRVLAFGYSENRSNQWDRMMEAERPDAMIAWGGRPALAKWATQRKLRTLFVGGATEGKEVTMFAVRSVDMVSHAVAELLALGHRRLFLPMCNRPASTVKAVRQAVAQPLRALGVKGQTKDLVPESSYQGGSVIEAMVLQALRSHSPTGWIFFDWREFLAAACVFRDLGLKVPDDLSMIVLSEDPVMTWYRPAPAHFRQPLETMAKEVVEWMLDESATGNRYFAADWFPGESLAAPKG
ncbi:substrate-binding domain-containing protein [Luteolibacter arcticus]|uniref:Substrate-binding domain-containing protein n=1 Tax=Luteolibacter arcticus TaxID=1581411 RepID=A0ABT3GM79_9BACT|nr:substrate-binding domain-containing protein [Luteolibacter arcticus]MCW1924634.1 substrate-binding domain-containing protein [Luteolibacter arcticus]